MSTKYSSWTSTNPSLTTMNTDSSAKVDQLDNINTSTSSEMQSSSKLSNEDASTTTKAKPKHRCHHHHSGKHKCRHHQRRLKASIQHSKSLSSPRLLRKKSGKTTHRKVSNNEESAVITDTVSKMVLRTDDEQQVASSTVRKGTTQQKIKSSQGSIPLQSVENKLVSQRETTANEMQVGNCSSCVYTQPMINTCAAPQFENVYYDDNCCLPSTVSCATNSCSCTVCVSQQQPLVCTSGISSTSCVCSSTSSVCSTGNSGFLQQIAAPQQQIVYVNNPAPATFINQTSTCNPIAVNSFTSPTVCVSQAPLQSVASFAVQQQPQVLTQPLQLIQSPQAQTVQYIQVPSAAPQIIQIPAQAIAASPQILYQRPYDSLAMPVQSQQLAVGNIPGIPLRYPSYAPPRIVSGTPVGQNPMGPNLFRQALVRSVANRTGTPVLMPSPMGSQLMQPPISSPGIGGPLLSTASALPNPGLQRSISVPIIPLTAGGLLIPFKPSESLHHPVSKTVSRTGTNPSNLVKFDTIRRQIQDRGRVLADLRRMNANQAPALALPSANVGLLSRPTVPLNMSVPPPILSPITPQLSSPLAPNIMQTPLAVAPNTMLPRMPPPVIRSQTPYTSGNIFGSSSGSSSSSSDRSAASSIIAPTNAQPSSSGLVYSQPSFTGSAGGSVTSGPSPGYQPLTP